MSAGRAEIESALFDLQQYLSDRIAPLMFAEALEILMYCPPELTAHEIGAWTAGQYVGGGQPIPVSDYLFHALRKIHQMAELELVPAAALASYLGQLREKVLEACPEQDRELLRTNVERLAQSQSGPPPAAAVLYRQQEPVDVASAPLASERMASLLTANPGDPPEVAAGLRRLGVLIERLAHLPALEAAGSGVTLDARHQLVSEALASAAAGSQSGKQLDLYLDELKRLGLPAQTEKVFQVLAESLPGWMLPSSSEAEPKRRRLSGPAETMYRLVSLAPDPTEAARRFRELVHAAIRQFNEGLLSRAAAMLEVAERLVEQKQVPTPSMDAVKLGGHDYLDPDRLRRYAEGADKHFVLRRVLTFFTALLPEPLLDELKTEERHDRRRLLLALVEAHGEAGRAAVLQRLQAASATPDEADAFFLRNLVHLLRTMARPDEASAADVEAILRVARPGRLPSLVKEAVTALGKLRGERAEVALFNYLRSFEAMMLRPETATYGPDEVAQLLDRTASSLVRLGTRNALRALVEHGLKDQPELGDTRARLAELGSVDLAPHPDAVARLVAALRAELPRAVMGVVVVNKRKAETLHHLVTALAGTTAPEAQALLSEIASRFPGEEFGRAAAKAAAAGPKAAAGMSLSGDLDLFGLPTLLQNLAEIRASGTLTLFDANEAVVSAVMLEQGRMRACRTGPLRNQEALFNLLERPFPGRFAFAGLREQGPRGEPDPELPEVLPLLLEGLRRYDEYQRACVLAPDTVRLRLTGKKPAPPEDESNEALVESIWERASQGATPVECEGDFPVDPFRVRRLLAHWIEEGALRAG